MDEQTTSNPSSTQKVTWTGLEKARGLEGQKRITVENVLTDMLGGSRENAMFMLDGPAPKYVEALKANKDNTEYHSKFDSHFGAGASKAILSDDQSIVGTALDIGSAILSGPVKAMEEFSDFIGQDLLGLDAPPENLEDAMSKGWTEEQYRDYAKRGERQITPEGIRYSDTTAGDVTEGISQFLGGYAMLPGAGVGKVAGAAVALAKGAFVDGTMFDPDDPQVIELLDYVGVDHSEYLSWIDKKDDDNNFEKRLKAAAEGTGLGLVAEAVLTVAGKAAKGVLSKKEAESELTGIVSEFLDDEQIAALEAGELSMDEALQKVVDDLVKAEEPDAVAPTSDGVIPANDIVSTDGDTVNAGDYSLSQGYGNVTPEVQRVLDRVQKKAENEAASELKKSQGKPDTTQDNASPKAEPKADPKLDQFADDTGTPMDRMLKRAMRILQDNMSKDTPEADTWLSRLTADVEGGRTRAEQLVELSVPKVKKIMKGLREGNLEEVLEDLKRTDISIQGDLESSGFAIRSVMNAMSQQRSLLVEGYRLVKDDPVKSPALKKKMLEAIGDEMLLTRVDKQIGSVLGAGLNDRKLNLDIWSAASRRQVAHNQSRRGTANEQRNDALNSISKQREKTLAEQKAARDKAEGELKAAQKAAETASGRSGKAQAAKAVRAAEKSLKASEKALKKAEKELSEAQEAPRMQDVPTLRETVLSDLKKLVDDGVQLDEASKIIDELLKELPEKTRGPAYNASSTNMNLMVEMMVEYRTSLGLLSGPKTMMVNAVSAMFNTVARPALRAVGGAVANPLAAHKEFQTAFRTYAGMKYQMGSTVSYAGQAYKSGRSILSTTSRAEEIADSITPENLKKLGVPLLNHKPVNFTVNVLGEAVRFFSKGLVLTDEFFKRLQFNGETMATLYLVAERKGLKGKEAKQWVLDELPRMVDEDGHASHELVARVAQQRADEGLFTLDGNKESKYLVDKAIAHMQEVANKHAWLRATFIPFVRTPTRILEHSMRITPGVNMVSSKYRDDLKGVNGSARAALARGEMLFGLSMVYLGWEAAERGDVQVSVPYNKGDRDIYQALRIRNHSINIGDNNWIDISQFQPFVVPFMMSAAVHKALENNRLANQYNYQNDWDKIVPVMRAVLAEGTELIASMPMLQGLADTGKFIQDGVSYLEGENSEPFIKGVSRYLSSYVPNIYKKVSAVQKESTGEYQYAAADYGPEADGRFAGVWNKSVAPWLNSVQYDMFGDKTPANTMTGLVLGVGTQQDNDPVKLAVKRLIEVSGKNIGTLPRHAYKGEDLRLYHTDTGTFHDRILELRGSLKDREGRNLKQYLRHLMTQENLQGQTIGFDGELGGMSMAVQKVFDMYTAMAIAQLTLEHPEEMEGLLEKDVVQQIRAYKNGASLNDVFPINSIFIED